MITVLFHERIGIDYRMRVCQLKIVGKGWKYRKILLLCARNVAVFWVSEWVRKWDVCLAETLESLILNSNLVWRLRTRREHLIVISAPPTVTLMDDQMILDYDVTRRGAVIQPDSLSCGLVLIVQPLPDENMQLAHICTVPGSDTSCSHV
jgi:hypothetical protein